jgi:hypothetical protein
MAALDVPAQADQTEHDQTDHDRRVERLVSLSANSHDAYDDVDWSVPLDPEDPRLQVFSFDPLSHTDWYRRLPAPRKAKVGLARAAASLRTGWEFENLLQQGLLRHAYEMNNTNASFRYLHTEVIEESQHTLMFYEFIRRHAPHVEGITGWHRVIADPLVAITARTSPALFYFMVLGGELPIDHMQRLALKETQIHPLLQRIISIHVEEEARHVAFANAEVRRIVPALSRRARQLLSMQIPLVLGIMVPMMNQPAPWLVKQYDIPKRDLARAYASPAARTQQADSVYRIQRVAERLGLLHPAAKAAWKAANIYTSPRRAGRTAVATA